MAVRIVQEWTRPVLTAPRPRGGPLPWSTPDPSTLPGPPKARLYVVGDVVDAIAERSREGALRRHEDLGLLVGDWARDEEGDVYAVALDLSTGPLETSPVSVRFTREGLVEVARQLDALEYAYVLVGWYHTHLDLGALMSDRDLRTQRGGFPHPHQVALVVDAMRGVAAGFANGPDGPGTLPVAVQACTGWERPARP